MSSVTGERLSPQPHHDLTDRFYLDQVFPQGNRVGDATAVRLWEKGILQTRVWRKEKQLSADGFGTVWREREETSNEVRTLKRIRRDKDKASLQEIAALATFSAPRYLQHFADFYGWYLDSGYVYLSLEYFEHGDLHRCIGRLSQPLPEQEAKSIVHQVLNGVKCLHDRNFTHRDLKPNVSRCSCVAHVSRSDSEAEHICTLDVSRMARQNRRFWLLEADTRADKDADSNWN